MWEWLQILRSTIAVPAMLPKQNEFALLCMTLNDGNAPQRTHDLREVCKGN